MKIKTLVAAAALATASTAAVADVTTADGELVMVEKNQANLTIQFLTTFGPIAAGAVITAIAASAGTE